MNAVNDVLASGMAWDDLESMISEEEEGNPVAKSISLDLKNNQVTIKLTPEDVEIGKRVERSCREEAQTDRHTARFGFAGVSNCSAFRAEEKTRHETRQDSKTPRQSRIGCRKALIKIEALREKAIPGAKAARTPFWFEKFIWWVTSKIVWFYATDNTQEKCCSQNTK